jgi:GNAT superfamily N-acetyltransferase
MTARLSETVHVRAIREVCLHSYSADQIASGAGLLSSDNYVAVVREQFPVVAEDEGGIAGFGQLNQDIGGVEAVYVLPGRQGEGIGRALLRSLEDAARVVGLKRLHLSATLNAAPFYERAGYVEEGPAVHRLPTGVELQCLRMSRELAPS